MSSKMMMTIAQVHQDELRRAAEYRRLVKTTKVEGATSPEPQNSSGFTTFVRAHRPRLVHALGLRRGSAATSPSV